MDDLDMRLLKIAQDGVAMTNRPYLCWGEQLGISEEETIARLRELERIGVIRRFAATIGHRALGIVANAMIVWKVSPSEVEDVGEIFASFDAVTHCYERVFVPDWSYNLYTMVHSKSREECIKTARELATASGINDYKILFSEREYKKTSARI